MTILYVLNGLGFSRGMPIGGADKRALEIGERLQRRGVKVSFLTTDAGKEVLEKWGLKSNFIVVKRPFFWPRFLENNLLGRTLAYFYVVLADLLRVLPLAANSPTRRVEDFKPDGFFLGGAPQYLFIYPTSDQFFDLLPAVFLKLFLKRSNLPPGRFHPTGVKNLKILGIVHHWIPSPLKRGGNFVVNGLLFLSQRVGFLILKLFADLIFIPKTDEGEKIKGELGGFGVSKDRLASFLNGVSLEEISKVPEQEKKYEACFLGGFRPSKGIFDLVPIWQEVLKKLPLARLLVIGGGAEEYEKKLRNQVSHLRQGFGGQAKIKAGDQVILAGVLPQDKLFRAVKSCKIFISPSYEEGWGIVVGEALACGLPVIAYNLPAYRPFGEAVEKVSVGDKEAFAERVVKLLTDKNLRNRGADLGRRVVKNFSWEKAAEEEYKYLVRIDSKTNSE